MTIPTFKGGDIPELPESLPLNESSPVPLQGGNEAQSIRMLASTVFSYVRMPYLSQPPLPALPMHKVNQHELIKHFIHRFSPSFTQLAVMSHLQAQPAAEKTAAPENPKEASSHRDEAAPKQAKEENPVNLEVFSSEKGQGRSDQQDSSRGEGRPTASTEQESPTEPSLPAELAEAVSDQSKLAPAGDKSQPSEGSSSGPAQPQKGPKADVEAELPLAEPDARLLEAEISQIVPPDAKSNQAVEKPLPDGAEGQIPSQPVEAIHPAASIEKSAEHAIPQAAESKSGAPLESKEAQFKPDAGQPPSGAASKTDSSVPSSQTEQMQPKSELKVPGKELPMAGRPAEGAKNEKPIGPETKLEAHAGTVEKKEIKAVEPHAERLKVHEDGHEHGHKELKLTPVVVDPQIARYSSEEAIQANHRIFQAIDRDISLQVPPWLAQLLPDLTKAELYARKGGGGKAGKVSQNAHKLSDMLFMLFCASVGGAASLAEVIRFIEAREKWFTVVLGLKHGLPPRQLFFWLLATLDADKFDRTLRLWLHQILGGKGQGKAWLSDIVLWQTSLGFIVGQAKHAETKSDMRQAVELVDGFMLEHSVLMVKPAGIFESLLAKVKQAKADYLAEVKEELHPGEDARAYESYLEGQERVVVREWSAGNIETHLAAQIEFFDPRGTVQQTEFYTCSLENAADYYFDLNRLQRPYANQAFWLLNIALSFPSIEEALRRSQATLDKLQRFACDHISEHSGSRLPVEKQMEKAAQDLAFLMQLCHL